MNAIDQLCKLASHNLTLWNHICIYQNDSDNDQQPPFQKIKKRGGDQWCDNHKNYDAWESFYPCTDNANKSTSSF